MPNDTARDGIKDMRIHGRKSSEKGMHLTTENRKPLLAKEVVLKNIGTVTPRQGRTLSLLLILSPPEGKDTVLVG